MIYIETGARSGEMFNLMRAIAEISPKSRGEILNYIEGKTLPPEGSAYFEKNCELTKILHEEIVSTCKKRMKFQNIQY
ncbi:hypothetical protein D9M68_701430 [compost metagenome]